MFGGGADVETVLHSNQVRPGGHVQGSVNIRGGHTKVSVNFIELALTARVEVETEDSEYDANVVYYKNRISGSFQLDQGQTFQVPFSLEIPWNTPFNVLSGTRFHGVRIGLRTELDIARSTDKKDVDPLEVIALPSHEALVVGLSQLGFRLKGSDLERGRLSGSPLPFYQEVEFSPADHFRGRMNELEVKFITDAQGMTVVLEIDRKSVFGSSDKTNRFHVDHATAAQQDWASVMQQHLDAIMGGGIFGGVASRATPNLNTAPPAYSPPPAPNYVAPQYGSTQPQYGSPQPQYGAPQPQPQSFSTPPQAPTYGSPPPAPAYQPPAAPTYGAPPAAPAYGAPPAAPTYGAPPAAPAYQPPAAPTPAPAPAPPPAPAPAAPAAPSRGSINISKGGDINLSKQAPGLTEVTVGVGWGTSVSGGVVDIDLAAVVTDGSGRALGEDYFIFFNNLRSPEGAVLHGGDAKSGDRHGDDEFIQVDLRRCPPVAQRIAFVVSMDGSGGQTFGHVRDAYIRIVNSANGKEIARYDLDAQASNAPAVVFGELRRAGSDWAFAAVGQGNSQGLAGVVREFGLSV